MADKPHVVKISAEADFADLVRKADRASVEVGKFMAAAMKKGVSGTKFTEVNRKMEALVTRNAKLQRQLDARRERQLLEAEGTLDEKRAKNEEELHRLRLQLTQKELGKEVKLRLEAEKEVAEERAAILNEGADEYAAKLSEGVEALEDTLGAFTKLEKNTERSAKYYTRSAERVGKVSKWFKENLQGGADKFVETLSDGMDNVVSKLTSGVDAGALARGGGKALGQGIGQLGDMAGGLKTVGPALAAIAGVLGPLTVGMGLFLGVMFDTDKKIKEFNKTAINTYGSLSLARLGGGDLTSGLKLLNHTVTDLVGNLGVTQDEAMGVFDALDRGGFTLNRLTAGTTNAADAQKVLSRGLTDLTRVAQASGVSMSEYATNLTDYVDTLGGSLDTVNDSFASIADMAARSAFGTRRFYSMVVQATAGQASLNTRLEDTADLLMNMSKVLGAKKAAEMASQHGNGLANMSTQDRYRMILTSGGGRVRNVLGQEATHQARNFAVEAGKKSGDITAALSESGLGRTGIGSALTAAGGNASNAGANDALVKELRKLSDSQSSALVASLTSRDAGLGRQVQQLITVTRGTSGSMADMSAAMSGVSAGGSIVMKLQSAMAILGKPLNELTGVERMAAENITGVSGEQFEMLQKVAQNAQGQYAILQTYLHKQVTPEMEQDLVKRFGATVRGGQIVAARLNNHNTVEVGDAVTSSNQMITAYMERTGDSMENLRTEQSALQHDTFDATVSVADILENKILYYVRSLYEDVGQPLIAAIAKWVGGTSENQRVVANDARQALTARMEQAQAGISNRGRQLSDLTSRAGYETDTTKRTQILGQIKQLEADQDTARRTMDAYRTARTSLAMGDYSSLNETRTYAGAGGGPDITEVVGQRTAEQVVAAIANGVRPAAPGATPAAALPTAGATPAAAQNPATAAPAPVAVAPSPNADTNPVATTTNVAATAASATTVATAVTTQADQTRAHTENLARQGQQHMTRLLTRDVKLGNSLAKSNLPDAIAEAQVRQQFQAEAFAAGLGPEQVKKAMDQYFTDGTLTQDLRTGLTPHLGEADTMSGLHRLGIRPEDITGTARHHRLKRPQEQSPEETSLNRADDFGVDAPAHDFIYRNNGGAARITPIDREDQITGSRPGGPIQGPGGGGGNRTVNITVNGGNPQAVLAVVRQALNEGGYAPNRVRGNA